MYNAARAAADEFVLQRHPGDSETAYDPLECAHQVDFAHYKKVLKNQEVVSELEKTFNNFKPVDYDVAAQLKAIDSFQGKAVRSTLHNVHGYL